MFKERGTPTVIVSLFFLFVCAHTYTAVVRACGILSVECRWVSGYLFLIYLCVCVCDCACINAIGREREGQE